MGVAVWLLEEGTSFVPIIGNEAVYEKNNENEINSGRTNSSQGIGLATICQYVTLQKYLYLVKYISCNIFKTFCKTFIVVRTQEIHYLIVFDMILHKK